jgi:hypothetical protein
VSSKKHKIEDFGFFGSREQRGAATRGRLRRAAAAHATPPLARTRESKKHHVLGTKIVGFLGHQCSFILVFNFV